MIITFFDLYFRKRISSIKFLSPCFILKKFLVQVKVYFIMIPFTFIYSWMNGYFSQMRIDGTGFHWIGPTGNEVFLFYYSAHLFSNKLYSLAPFNVIHKTRKDKRIRVSSIFIIACIICLPRFYTDGTCTLIKCWVCGNDAILGCDRRINTCLIYMTQSISWDKK